MGNDVEGKRTDPYKLSHASLIPAPTAGLKAAMDQNTVSQPSLLVAKLQSKPYSTAPLWLDHTVTWLAGPQDVSPSVQQPVLVSFPCLRWYLEGHSYIKVKVNDLKQQTARWGCVITCQPSAPVKTIVVCGFWYVCLWRPSSYLTEQAEAGASFPWYSHAGNGEWNHQRSSNPAISHSETTCPPFLTGSERAGMTT